LAFLTVPFLVFIIPRSYESLHPNVSIINRGAKMEMSGIALILLILCVLNMTLLFAWIYSIEIRLFKKLHQLRQKEQNAG
jgi:heme exporter protein C